MYRLLKVFISHNLRLVILILFSLLIVLLSTLFYVTSLTQSHSAIEAEISEAMFRAARHTAKNIEMHLQKYDEPLEEAYLSELIAPLSFAEGYAFIVDKNRKILAHKKFSNGLYNAKTLSDKENVIIEDISSLACQIAQDKEIKNFDSHEKRWSLAYASIHPLGWKVIITAPNDTTHVRANYLSHSLFIVFSVIMFIALIVTYLVADIILRYQRKLEKEKKEREEELLRAKNKYETTLSALPDLFFEMGLDGTYYDYHSPDHTLLAAPPEVLLGKKVSDLLPLEAANVCLMALQEANISGYSKGKTIELLLEQGTTYFELSIAKKPHQNEDTQAKFIVLSRDITERKKAEERNYYLANFDSLTGLANRIQLENYFAYTLGLAKRHDSVFALVFLDLDRFKEINDSLGHHVGDKILMELSRRLQSIKRESDMIARLGGDEFMILLPNTDKEGATHVAQKILDITSKPYHIEKHLLRTTASLGIALYPQDGIDLEILSQKADIAMYKAKELGRNQYHFVQ